MPLWLLLFLAIVCMVIITLISLAVTKKGYEHQHTIDPAPSTTSDKEINKS
ncbi:MAG: YtzI protein [Paenisporosarcina sp.]